jgi:precorrin-6Y C5,15-methyltransferase (decarboxylating)
VGGSGGTRPAQAGTGTDGWLAGLDPGDGVNPRGWGLEPAAYGQPVPGLDPLSGAAPAGPAGRDPRLRALQLAALGPHVGELMWDIGTGDGLAAVEAARLGSAVIALDRDAGACALAEATARRLGVQMHVVHGIAPQALARLPEPDVVRVGGGGPRTLAACADRRPQRLVTHALTRDQMEAAGRVLGGAGYEVRCTLVQSVELETRDWTERGRAVAFLLVGSRLPMPQ